MKETRYAWAIDTRSKECHGYIGIWFVDPAANPLEYQEGVTTALWKTRRLAREFVAIDRAKTYRPFPRMKVVRVGITISLSPPPQRKAGRVK